ncbi:hypothetical protein GFY24_17375 [Nocardia sp. SYP-A9097]|nr:hypothetical protein [Nocardia sp. SYP-A9097]
MALSESETKILTALAAEQLTVQRLVAVTGLTETTVRNALYKMTYDGLTVGRGSRPATYEISDLGRLANSRRLGQFVPEPPAATS